MTRAPSRRRPPCLAASWCGPVPEVGMCVGVGGARGRREHGEPVSFAHSCVLRAPSHPAAGAPRPPNTRQVSPVRQSCGARLDSPWRCPTAPARCCHGCHPLHTTPRPVPAPASTPATRTPWHAARLLAPPPRATPHLQEDGLAGAFSVSCAEHSGWQALWSSANACGGVAAGGRVRRCRNRMECAWLADGSTGLAGIDAGTPLQSEGMGHTATDAPVCPQRSNVRARGHRAAAQPTPCCVRRAAHGLTCTAPTASAGATAP